MPRLRRAVIFASGGRYLVMVINFVTTMTVARLLTPAEFGVSVLGAAVLAMAEAIRELGSVTYLVQERNLTHLKLRTVFTISMIVTACIAILLWLFSDGIAAFYKEPSLAEYIRVVAISYAIAPFAHPIYAILNRDMDFGKIAILEGLSTLVNGIAAVLLVSLGFTYMGLAWAWVVSSVCWTLLGFCVMRDFSIYRPSLHEWRSVLAFGACGSARAVLYKSADSLYYLILGLFMSARSVGLCQRSLLLAQFPERVILAGIGAVALPAFSEHARQGGDLKSAYLKSLENASVVVWPAILLLCILASPIVALLLGPQWKQSAPLLQILAIAYLANPLASLNFPVLVVTGSIRSTVFLAFTQTIVSLAVVTCVAHDGLWVVALSTLITIPANVGFSTWLVRSVVSFTWRELGLSLKRSAICAVVSIMLPSLIAVRYDWGMDMPLSTAVCTAILCALSWIVALWLTRHPLFVELSRFSVSLLKLVTTRFKPLERLSARLRLGV